MLLARLLGWIKSHKTFHIFTLEVLAVFIGITASLFIDDWRQRQQDREILDHLLEAAHYNAMQDDSMLRRVLGLCNAALEDTLWLLYGEVSAASDEELLRRYQNASLLAGLWDVQPGYQRLLNTSLSIPFDHTMAELDFLFRQVSLSTETLNETHARMAAIQRELLAAAELSDNPSTVVMFPILGRWNEEVGRLGDIFVSHDGRAADLTNAVAVRAALETPGVRRLLRELVGMRFIYNATIIAFGDANDDIIASIRAYDPDVTLPVGVIELIGDATSVGWERGLPMTRDSGNPNVWRLRVRLTDGTVKFRADNNWSTNWGAPNRAENTTTFMFEFGGDPSAVFPQGTAEFGGLNIPVEAGTYDLIFKSQSFEYSFDRVNGTD